MTEFRVRFEQEDGKGEIVNEKGIELTAREVVDCLNEQQVIISDLEAENDELRQKEHWVYVDVDNANGCMNCKYDIGGICSILDCGTHDYLVGVSECALKYWECKDE